MIDDPTHLDSARIARWFETGAWSDEILPERLEAVCARRGDELAIADGAIRLRFADVIDLVRRLATGLAGIGITQGDVVSFQLPTWWESVIIAHAAFRLGAVANPIGPNLRAYELDQIFRAAAPAVFFVGDHRGRAAADALVELSWRPEVVVPVRAQDGTASWDRLLRPPAVVTPVATSEPTSAALLLFTSGSTAAPKGVIHGHGDLLAEVDGLARAHELVDSDGMLVALPISHIGGTVYGMLLTLGAGIRATFLDTWDPSVALRLIEDDGLTVFSGVPTYLDGILGLPDFGPHRVASLRLFAMGGMRVIPDDIVRAAAAFGCVCKRSYGSTEAPTLTTGSAGDDPAVLASTDGRPIWPSQVRVVDQHGRDVETGEMGEIWCEAPEMFLGYLDPALNEGAFSSDGWFRTGDVGSLDPSGSLTVRGRLKDVIIRGGENITPVEIEQLLTRHPSVVDAAVVAMPDPVYGERACAFVVTDDPSFNMEVMLGQLRRFRIASFKLPERLEVRRELPVTSSGKVRKDLLRNEIAALLKQEASIREAPDREETA